MRKRTTRLVAGLGVGVTLLAAVPAAAMVPLHMQRRNELHRVLDLPALGRLGPIERIERIAADMWRVTAGRCHIDIRMVPRARTGRGLLPPRIEPVPGRQVCRR